MVLKYYIHINLTNYILVYYILYICSMYMYMTCTVHTSYIHRLYRERKSERDWDFRKPFIYTWLILILSYIGRQVHIILYRYCMRYTLTTVKYYTRVTILMYIIYVCIYYLVLRPCRFIDKINMCLVVYNICIYSYIVYTDKAIKRIRFGP